MQPAKGGQRGIGQAERHTDNKADSYQEHRRVEGVIGVGARGYDGR